MRKRQGKADFVSVKRTKFILYAYFRNKHFLNFNIHKIRKVIFNTKELWTESHDFNIPAGETV